MHYYLGIDQGTSACRAVITDPAGIKVAFSSQPLACDHTTGTPQQTPDVWWQACRNAVLEVMSQVEASQIRALAIDATSTSLLLTDHAGQPLTEALMYNDNRAELAAQRVSRHAPATAAVHGPTSSLSKLLWLLAQPTVTVPCYVAHQADWLSAQFSGRYGLSDENNVLKLGYDAGCRQWPDWLDSLGIDYHCLPQVLPAGSIIGPVSSRACEEFGFARDCQVVAGTTDSTAACIAAGISIPGDALTVLGSTLVLKVISEQPVFAPEYGIYSHRLGDLWLVGGASNSGGNVLRHYYTDQQLQHLSANIDPQRASGVNYYPLIGKGERFPSNDPAMTGKLLPRLADPAEFLHGLLEGIARIEQQGYDLLNQLGAPKISSVRTSGGGAGNKTWQEIRQQLLKVPMLPAIHTEAAYGAAQLARLAFH